MKKTFALLLMLVLALGVSVQAATLPAGYTQVDYIQSEGRGYIDTGFVPADAESSIAYEIDFCYDIADFSDNNKVMLGVGADSKRAGNVIAGMNTTSFQSKTAICFGDQAPGSAAAKYDNTLDRVVLDISMDLTNGTYTVKKDGVVVGTENTAIVGDVKSAYSLYLFASHNASAPAYYAPGKVYGLKMWADDTLVRDFVPCYRVSDDVAGLYDVVGGAFYCAPTTDSLFYPGQERELVEGDTAIVVNATTGEVYYGKDTKLEHGMASTTKVMTCILTIENMALTDRTLVANEFDCDTSGSMMYLQVGEQLLIKDALRGLMLPSGNDAAKLLARTVGTKIGNGYDSFIELMNQKAVEIGMMNTHYNSPIGGEYTTVEDYAKLGVYCMQNPIFRDVVQTVDWTIEADPAHGVVEHVLRNTNYLLPGTFVGSLPSGDEFGDTYEYEGITGIKTGTTSSAGACLLATATREINGENVDLVSVILGTNGNTSARNRFTETIKMFDLGFEKAKTVGYDVTVEGNVLTAKNPETGYTMTATITAPDVALTGATVEPAVVNTTYEGGNMTWNTYWDITYTNNDKVGTATASITFGGKTATCEFEIVEPTVTLTADTTVDTLVVPAGQTYDLNGKGLVVMNGLVVNEGGKIVNGELTVAKTAVAVNLGSNGGWIPVWVEENDAYNFYELYPAAIKAGKTVVSTETGTTYSFGYKLTENNGFNPYADVIAAGDKIKFGVQLDLGETKVVYKFSESSIAKMAGINASASSDEFFKVNLNLTGANNPLTKVRVAPVIKVDALGFAYVGEATGETDGEYVARVGNNDWYYTIEDAIAAAEATGEVTDVKIIRDIEFKRPVTLKMNGKVRFRTAADAVVTISGPVTFDGQGIAADCALFYFNGDLGEITLDGVTIRNYNNTGADSVNNYGSVIAATGSTVTLRDVTIENCVSKSRGAAFYGYNYTSLIAENCTFENLTGNASYGGAISIVNAKIVDLDSCEFINCASKTYGGAIAVREGTSDDLGTCDVTMTIDNCAFTDCAAATTGGAISFGNGTLTLCDNSFEGNKAAGVTNDVYVDNGSVTLDGDVTDTYFALAENKSIALADSIGTVSGNVISGTVGTTVLTGAAVAEKHTGFGGMTEDITVTEEGVLKTSKNYVAQVGTAMYESLFEAFEDTKNATSATTISIIGSETFTEPTTLTMGKYVNVVVSGVDVTISGPVTIDGQGVTNLSGTHTFSVEGRGTLTLADGVVVKGIVSTTATSGAIRGYIGNLVLDGVTIENCTGVRGAVYMAGTTSLSITDTIFRSNTATSSGGALYLYGSTNPTTISGSTFTGNTAATNGGAIYLTNGATVNLSDTSFSGNKVGTAANDAYVNNGTFGISGEIAAESVALAAGKTVTINGALTVAEGTTIGIDGAVGQTVLSGSAVADYYKCFSSVNEGEVINSAGVLVSTSGVTYVAEYGGTKYEHLADAVEEAKKAGAAVDVYLIGTEEFTEETTIALGDTVRLYVNSGEAAALSGKLTLTGGTSAVHMIYVDGALTLTGVTVKDHVMTATSLYGAIRPGSGSTLTLNNATITNLKASRGAIYANKATVNATNTTFSNNTSTTFGGAISTYNSSKITLTGCTFTGNKAAGSFGGAIATYSSNAPSVTMSGCHFAENTAASYGGAIGIYAKGNTIKATDTTFENNTSTTYGGTIATRDNAEVTGGSYTFEGCEFTENGSGSSAGVMYLRGDSTTKSTFTDCDFIDNAAGTHSGVAYIYHGTHGFKDCTFTGNSATTAGEAALKATSYAEMTLDGCTFADNSDYDIYNYNMTLTLKNKNNIESIYLRATSTAQRAVTPDASFTTDAPIALIPQGGVGHAVIAGSYIADNLDNFFVAKADGTADTTLTIGADGVVAAVAAE